jgi:hypothetical protein
MGAMADVADKARALRLKRLQGMLDTRLDQPALALQALMQELRDHELRPELWEALHAAAARDEKETELADAYRKAIVPRALRDLPPHVGVGVLMNAASFFQGVLGDAGTAASLLERVLEVDPTHVEAFSRLEGRFRAQNDRLRLLALYGLVAASPPRPASELVRVALQVVVELPASTSIPEDVCTRLLALVPASPSLLDALQTHCRKTGRPALAGTLGEKALDEKALPDAVALDQRRRLIDLYTGEAAEPAKAMPHVEDLLLRDPHDAQGRQVVERLLSVREVGSRAAAALQQARRQQRPSK